MAAIYVQGKGEGVRHPVTVPPCAFSEDGTHQFERDEYWYACTNDGCPVRLDAIGLVHEHVPETVYLKLGYNFLDLKELGYLKHYKT